MSGSETIEEIERRLAGILAADIVGYSALVDENEETAIKAVKALWTNVVDPSARKAGGRIVKTMGDGVLAEFPSAVKAVECALSIQEATTAGVSAFPDGIQLRLRIGLHLGDVIIDGNDILGEGVNLAARLEGLAEPGSICISAALRDQLTRDLANLFSDQGEHQVKNISKPVRVFSLSLGTPGEAQQIQSDVKQDRKPTVAIGAFNNLTKDETSFLLTQGCQQTTAAFLSSLTGLKLVSPNATPDYTVQASIQIAGGRYRCLLKILEKSNDQPIHNNRLDGELDDPFEAQDSLSGMIATSVRYAILESEADKAAQSKTTRPGAEQWLAQSGQLLMGLSSGDWNLADKLLDQYIAERPDDFMALSMKACVRLREVVCGVLKVSAEDSQLAAAYLTRARELNEQSDFMHLIRATYCFGVDQDVDAALRAVNRSLEITPEYVLSLNIKAMILAFSGRPDQGLAAYSAIASTMSKNRIFHRVLGVKSYCQFAQADYEAVIETTLLALDQEPEFAQALAMLAAAAQHTGRTEVSQKAMATLLDVVPDLNAQSLRLLPFRDSLVSDSYLSGLISAGMPEN